MFGVFSHGYGTGVMGGPELSEEGWELSQGPLQEQALLRLSRPVKSTDLL